MDAVLTQSPDAPPIVPAERLRANVLPSAIFYALLCSPLLLLALLGSHTPFVNDEAKLIGAAMDANQHHRLAAVGLVGSRGIPYGPTPTHIYQGLLWVSGNDLAAVTRIHGVIMILSLALGLAWLASELKLWRWFAVAVMCAPLLWLAAGQLWDNTFAIPISVLTLASYGRFVRIGSRASLAGWVAGSSLLLSIHPMSLPLVAAIGIDSVWKHHRELAKRWVTIALTVLVFGATLWGYIPALIEAARNPQVIENTQRDTGLLTHGASAAFALCGATVLCGFQPVMSASELEGPLAGIARIVQQLRWLLMPISLGAVAIAIRRLSGRSKNQSVQRQAMYRVLLIGLLLLVGYFGTLRVRLEYHYFHGAWVIFLLMLWIAVDAIRPRVLATTFVALLALGSLSVTAATATPILNHAGSRTFAYGPDLQQQTHAVAAVLRRGDVVYTDVENFTRKPAGLQTLARTQKGIELSSPAGPGRVCVIRYLSDDPRDARLTVETESLDALWPKFQPISLRRIEDKTN